MTERPRLITIPFSHYCEKTRWALQACGVAFDEEGHLPLFAYLALRKRASVPVLVTAGETLADSTDIAAWAEARAPGTLYPTDPAEALALEDTFDRDLGPATRRWAYFHLLPRRDLDDVFVRGAPRWQARALKLARPLAVGFLRRGLKIDAAGVERSRQKIEATFAAVEDRLRDRRYLAGERFTIADLTFAALASPVVLPREHPVGLPGVEEFSGPPRAQIEAWRARPAGQHALATYARHRA